MKISANEIKTGMIIEHNNDLWEILKTQHVKPGKGGAFNQVEMKSINKNTKLNERFRSSDNVERAIVEEIDYNYLYEDKDEFYFINNKTFEQVSLKKEFPDLNKIQVSNAIDIITASIAEAVALDEKVEIRGFGTFSKKYIRPRRFINPKTKKVSYIGETATLHFKSSKSLIKK